MKEGNLRVWWIKNVPGKAKHFCVLNIKEAKIKIKQLADNDLKADSNVITNAGGLEIFENDKWVEWYDDEGNDICQIVFEY